MTNPTTNTTTNATTNTVPRAVEDPDPPGADTPEATCPSCRALVAAEEAFCESCGETLRADAVPAAADAIPTGADAGGPPGATRTIAAPDARAAHNDTCRLCGGDVSDDGFCDRCGARAATTRDHWTEAPSPSVAGVCDKGIAHARNEDAMALGVGGGPAAFSDDRIVLVVCDGVTTAPESDRASLAACAEAVRTLLTAPVSAAVGAAAVTEWSQHLRVACRAANAAAVAVARSLGEPPEPPSCTFVAAVVVPGTGSTFVAVAWCGDSRAYWFGDDGEARQLTTDHSLGTQMIEAGMSPADAEAEPTSHTITRWLGADSFDPTPEIVTFTAAMPGWLAVVSDGMWNYASAPAALGSVLLRAAADLDDASSPRASSPRASSPLAIAESMAAWANDQGGHDNITVALARINDSPMTTSAWTEE